MARLAAYYQEDFHYAPIGHGPKQRKAAYIVYEEPKNNLFNNGYINGGPRMRALAASDPSLSPTYSPKNGVMTLKAKPYPLNYNLVEQSRLAVQRLENMYEPPEVMNPYAVARLEAEMLDRESVYSHSVYDEADARPRHKSKDRTCKRLSYNDSWDSGQHIPDLCVDRYQCPTVFQDRSFDTQHSEYYPPNGSCVDPHEQCFTSPVSFRSDSSHGRWQQWPWNMADTRVSPPMLSPSPHDSGLSSQSITSSPSLEAEPLPIHNMQIQSVQPDVHHMCSCSPQVYAEPGRIVSPPSRYDSGRSSPGVYSVTLRGKKSLRKKSKHVNNGIVYVENNFEDEYARSQVRYGMLGIVNEPSQQVPAMPKPLNENYNNPEFLPNKNAFAAYYYIEENAGPVKVPEKLSSKSHKSQPKNVRPSVIIEPPDTGASKDTSAVQDNADKSPEPESSVSSPVTDPSSIAPSGNNFENEERRKSKKKTEKDIRELEDMYNKCNLGDCDLLERAERRDLPSAHQSRVNGSPSNLTRSKSDTFYEIMSNTYNNPYEIPARAPPLRRAGVPDIISDDMALRKHNKPVTSASVNPMNNTVTYMLCSSHFTPTVPCGRDIMLMDNPDIEYDDLSYRKHYFGKKSKILDPQPPFGIPLRPPPPRSVYNDYLHAVPNGGLQPLCHPRGNPDVVRDDMAYRTLRKDEPEVVYYETHRKRRG